MKNILKLTLSTSLLLTVLSVKSQDLPKELLGIYSTKPSKKYSDEFNGNRKNNAFDTKKWHYRESTKAGCFAMELKISENREPSCLTIIFNMVGML